MKTLSEYITNQDIKNFGNIERVYIDTPARFRVQLTSAAIDVVYDDEGFGDNIVSKTYYAHSTDGHLINNIPRNPYGPITITYDIPSRMIESIDLYQYKSSGKYLPYSISYLGYGNKYNTNYIIPNSPDYPFKLTRITTDYNVPKTTGPEVMDYVNNNRSVDLLTDLKSEPMLKFILDYFEDYPELLNDIGRISPTEILYISIEYPDDNITLGFDIKNNKVAYIYANSPDFSPTEVYPIKYFAEFADQSPKNLSTIAHILLDANIYTKSELFGALL